MFGLSPVRRYLVRDHLLLAIGIRVVLPAHWLGLTVATVKSFEKTQGDGCGRFVNAIGSLDNYGATDEGRRGVWQGVVGLARSAD